MSNYLFLLLSWVALGLIIAQLPKITGRASVGLPLAYFTGLFLIHWPGAAVYLVEGYYYYNPDVVMEGFYLTTWGVVAFAVGLLAISLLHKRLKLARVETRSHAVAHMSIETNKLAKFFLYTGLFSYLFLQPLLGGVATISAVVGGMAALSIVGTCLGVWGAVQGKNPRRFRWWLLVAFMFPFITLLNSAFVGYGVHSMITIFAFTLVLIKLRPRIVLIALIFAYLGMSFYVSYMRDRTEYRELVWQQQAGYLDRLEKVSDMFINFEFFDPDNSNHLRLVDLRLNQNHLVGSSIYYLEKGNRSFAGGETIFNAFIALIPRAVWPNKPKVGGGGDIVTNYTGISFAKGTSVGAGQILEFYVNFGRDGVLVGMFILGMLIGFFDLHAAYNLRAGNRRGFILWFLPGLGFLQAGGNLIEVTTTVGASVGTAMIAIFIARKYMQRKSSVTDWMPDQVRHD